MCKQNSNDMISLPDLCREISVSEATGKNWIRLGKIEPSEICDGKPVFSAEDVINIKNNIKNNTTVLKSRRNKKHISGNGVYNDYVVQSSPNISVVYDILQRPELKTGEPNKNVMVSLLAECALRLICCRTGNKKKSDSYLADFLVDAKTAGDYADFVKDIMYGCDNPVFFRDINFKFVKNEDTLGLLYISLKNTGRRKAKGEYYTPTEVVTNLVSNLFGGRHTKDKKVIDPCCGTGNFLLSLPKRISPQNIYACDIDEMSVKIARLNMVLKHGIKYAPTVRENIRFCNYLNHDFNLKFDYVLGNPPWGYAYSAEENKILRQKYKTSKRNTESYDVFTEQALCDLKNGGLISFILPAAILNVRSHKRIREFIINNASLKYIEYMGEVFDNVHCPCVIIQAEKSEKGFNTRGMTVRNGDKTYKIGTKRSVNSDYFDFCMTDEEYSILQKIEGIKNKVTLKNNADFALGIVTGNNKKYLFDIKKADTEAVLRGPDINKFYYTPPKKYIEFKPKDFQQCADEKFYRADEKLFYRFISSKLVFAYDNKKTLSLNSTNVLIPKIEGLDIKYVMSVLNSSVAQFYFKKSFNSIKVLRSHIEKIPIPFVDMDTQKKIISLVDEMISKKDSDGILFEKLDKTVAKLYGITDEEFEII